jgi:hypothetical protein
MIAYHHKAGDAEAARVHPWTRALENEANRYIDFKANPQLIRTSLEDWVPYKAEQFADTFFELLEWLNGEKSQLESNDCAFRGAHPNTTDQQFKFSQRCDGRLMVLYRDLYLNTQGDTVDWLFNETMAALHRIDKKFKAAAVGLSFMQTAYTAFGDGVKSGAFGFEIGFFSFAYGRDRSEAHGNMDRLLRNLRQALEIVNYRLVLGEPQKLLKPKYK